MEKVRASTSGRSVYQFGVTSPNAPHRDQADSVSSPQQRAYEVSPAGKATRSKYLLSEKGREARRVYQAHWVIQRRQLVDAIKLDRGCVDCGYNDNPAALQFDHVRGEKRFNVSQGIHHSWEKLMAEIAKCEVRCANCHAIKTHCKSNTEE